MIIYGAVCISIFEHTCTMYVHIYMETCMFNTSTQLWGKYVYIHIFVFIYILYIYIGKSSPKVLKYLYFRQTLFLINHHTYSYMKDVTMQTIEWDISLCMCLASYKPIC